MSETVATEKKMNMMLTLDPDVYEGLMNIKAKYSRKRLRGLRNSAFVQDIVFRPFIAAESEKETTSQKRAED